VTLTIHRGACQIGGNFVEVATASTRIIIDVGLPLTALDEPKRRKAIDPLVKAVFSKSPPVAAVLLSHAHADHSGLLDQTSETPVYMTRGTSMMLLAGAIYARGVDVERSRQRILKHREPVLIGDITVTAHPVDHSAFDSVAFEVVARGKRILYSGDLRLHGHKPGMAKKLIESIARVDALLMEGTHFSAHREPGPTEKELQWEIFEDIRSAPGLVLASFSPSNVDRFVCFYKAARKAGRSLVVDHYGGFILHLVSQIARIPKPSTRDCIRVFLPKKQKLVPKVSRCFRDPHITIKEVLAEPSRYVLLFRPSMINDDFEGLLPSALCCLTRDGYCGSY
jgi:ribonuclease J